MEVGWRRARGAAGSKLCAGRGALPQSGASPYQPGSYGAGKNAALAPTAPQGVKAVIDRLPHRLQQPDVLGSERLDGLVLVFVI